MELALRSDQPIPRCRALAGLEGPRQWQFNLKNMSIQPGDDTGNSSGHVAGERLNATYTSIKQYALPVAFSEYLLVVVDYRIDLGAPQKSRSSAFYKVRWVMWGLWSITMKKRRDYPRQGRQIW